MTFASWSKSVSSERELFFLKLAKLVMRVTILFCGVGLYNLNFVKVYVYTYTCLFSASFQLFRFEPKCQQNGRPRFWVHPCVTSDPVGWKQRWQVLGRQLNRLAGETETGGFANHGCIANYNFRVKHYSIIFCAYVV